MRRGKSPLDDLVAYREARGESQTEFWSRFGVTQSGGSRYENGRALPKPVKILLMAFASELLNQSQLNNLSKKIVRKTRRKETA